MALPERQFVKGCRSCFFGIAGLSLETVGVEDAPLRAKMAELGLVSVKEVHGIGDEKSATHLSALHASGECRERST